MSDDWRNEPATEQQMEKLRFFGCTWDEGILAGQANDALEECARQFPCVETAYQNSPATPELLRQLQSFGFESIRELTCGEAEIRIKQCRVLRINEIQEPQNGRLNVGVASSQLKNEFSEQQRKDSTQAEAEKAVQLGKILYLIKLRMEDLLKAAVQKKETIANPGGNRREGFFCGTIASTENRDHGFSEVTIQRIPKPQIVSPVEYTIPAHEVRGFADQQTRNAHTIIWPEFQPQLAGLKSQNKYARKVAAVALGRSRDVRAVEPLVLCLADDDWSVRMQAAQSLGDLGFIEAVEALVGALKDRELYIRKAAAEALGKINDTRAVDALIAIALEDPKEVVRQAAGQALVRMKEKASAYTTVKEYRDGQSEALEPIQDAVSAFSAQQLEPLLETCASSDNCHWMPLAKAAPLAQVSAETKFTIVQSRQIAHKIKRAGYCVEPDASFTGGSYDWNQIIGIFKSFDGDSTEPSSAYLAAANLLRLCVIVAAANSQTDKLNLDVFQQFIENQLELTQTDYRRLQVLETLLVQDQSSAAKALMRVAKSTPGHKRLLISKVLVRVAAADNVITNPGRRSLERIFKAFEISQQIMENLLAQMDLMPAGTIQKSATLSNPANRDVTPIKIQEGGTNAGGEWGSKPVSINVPKEFTLDMAKIISITNETKDVAGILSVLMDDETEKTPPLKPAESAAPQAILPNGLTATFAPILERLLTRDSWPLADFNALAREFQFMPLKIRDTLNEWSDEALGDFILEGEDPVVVRRDMMTEETI